MRQPCEDIDFLLNKFQSDVANVTGVPMDMVQGVTRVNESAQKTVSSGRLFMSKMTDLCRKLQHLLGEVYNEIYGESSVRFYMVPVSRLEINTVADLKVLFDVGCLTPDMSLQLSSLILGEELHNKRRRMQMMGQDNGSKMDSTGLKRLKKEAKGESGSRGNKDDDGSDERAQGKTDTRADAEKKNLGKKRPTP